ncbi:hypothetical protein NCCP1664_02990 [Zafaria cholistanensis]|uniref:DivIVA domain-containing protein n=1 Tax=Zafaria cholistanensis TaxID=1682741 RepID=A0A5A7NNR1_9MICC|nr:DivIVA domain-containing protein [Zafaria cholistanensis]GER21802.1 hypothetical protein NCCP1664_02990 [Zafaria cholistanensis]
MEIGLLFVAVLVLGGTVFALSGRRRTAAVPEDAGRGLLVGLVEPVPSLPPVLLPARPRASDIEKVRFAVGLRGYRADQVDEVLGVLGGEIERLHAELATRGTGV